MIPLRDDQPTSTFPIVTIILIGLNLLVFAAQYMNPLIETQFAMIPFEVTHHVDIVQTITRLDPTGGPPIRIHYGVSPHPIWLTIFTAMFMHAGLLHIGGNMLYLWIFGNNIEDALGKVRFIFFYFACGLAAALLQIATEPNSMIPTLGASGAIAGVLGAYLLLYPDARVFSIVPIFGFGFFAEVRAIWVLGLWIVLNIFQSLAGFGMPSQGGVAYVAHVGGFLAGLVLIMVFGGRRLVTRQKKQYYPPPSGGGGYF